MQREPHDEIVRAPAGLAPIHREGISGRRSGQARCPRPCKPRPYRRRRASRRCGSARWFRRSWSRRAKARPWYALSVGQVNETASNRCGERPPHIQRSPTVHLRTAPSASSRTPAKAVGAKAISFCLATLGARYRGFVPRFVLGEGLVLHFGKDKVMTDL